MLQHPKMKQATSLRSWFHMCFDKIRPRWQTIL